MKPALTISGAMISALERRMFCCSQPMSGSRRKFDSDLLGLDDQFLLVALRLRRRGEQREGRRGAKHDAGMAEESFSTWKFSWNR